jgi:hypothetical protein
MEKPEMDDATHNIPPDEALVAILRAMADELRPTIVMEATDCQLSLDRPKWHKPEDIADRLRRLNGLNVVPFRRPK